ncbi:hypothetical protein [Fervidobacterium nodosum]|uniref:Uncharacterized protein n=1 Tax=Fervidobacterium nodosum (strain ATCC 35602 / DSM 5306 / Rt17-B1) TaxID=381764 RepID=A7HJC1_FERNB|nr:hypothetical protein [Fervidobacterium nodosum]ABS60004.1 hypothetical protein Fnod_0137 [Fervidobacterium nodosum Rt17-B1]PHJ14277.1 hypothetical protein IM41_01850 [Fervidobacterium sp. SC_NGM5_G05]
MNFDPKKYREEKEKEIKQTYGSLRKRSFKFLFLNIMIVIAIFAFVFFVQRVSPQTYSNIVESLQLTVELPKIEYKAPDRVSAKVYITNTKRTAKDFIISDFYIKLYSNEKTLYEFSYPSAVQSSVEGLSKKLVYDLEKEIDISNLSAGTYTIYVQCKINGRQAEISRNFSYIEETEYQISIEPFYLTGEKMKPSLVIINRKSKQENLEIQKIIWKFSDFEYTQTVNDSIKIFPGEAHIIQSKFEFNIDKIGSFSQNILNTKVFLADGSIKEISISVPITKEIEISTKNIDFSLESEESVVASKAAKINIFMSNKQNTTRYLKMDKISFSIPKIGYNFEVGNRRFFFMPFSKVFVTKLERLVFSEPGVYELIVTTKSGDSTYQKKLTIAVGR